MRLAQPSASRLASTQPSARVGQQQADVLQAPPAPQTPNSAASKCQTAWIGGAERFCLFVRRAALTPSLRVQLPDAALTAGGQATIAGANSNAVAYCVRARCLAPLMRQTMADVGARDMPQGAIGSVHFLMTDKCAPTERPNELTAPDYQVTGVLNINKFPGINPQDPGGQYDPITGGMGLPIGGVLFQQHGCGCAC